VLQNRLREQKIENDSRISEMKHEFAMLRESEPVEVENPQLKEELRLVQRTNNELEIRIKQLLAELHEIREDKNRAVADKEQISISHSTQYGQSLTKVRSLESELERAHRRCERLQEENEQHTRNHNKMHDQVLRLEKERLVLQNQVESITSSFATERAVLKSNAEQREREAERQRGSLANQVSELNKRLETAQLSKQDLLRQFTQFQTEATEKMRVTIEREGEKQNHLELEKQHLQARVQELEGNVHLAKQQAKSEVQRVTKELETMRVAIQKSFDDRDAINKRLEAECMTSSHLRRELEDVKAESDRRNADVIRFKQDRDQFESKMLDEQNAAERYKLNIVYLEKQILELNETLERERSTRAEMLDQSNHKLYQDRKKLQDTLATLTQELDKTRSKYERLKVVHKETSDRYKKKIKSYQDKLDSLNNKLNQVEHQAKSEQDRIWEEKKHFSRRIAELEHERDKLSFLSASSNTAGDKSPVPTFSIADDSTTISSNYEKLYNTTIKNFKDLQTMSQKVDTWNK
jgi:chromosome segregation ATPase